MGDRDLWGEKPWEIEKKHLRCSKDSAEFFSEAPWYSAPVRGYYGLHLDDTSQGTRLLALAGSYQQPSELGRNISPISQMWTLRFQNPGFSFISQECSSLCIW